MSLNNLSFQAVPPKAGTPGVATVAADGTAPPAGAPAGAQGAPPAQWLMWAPMLILLPILFLSMRRQKKEGEQRAKLKKGDRVVTNAGLIGELIEMDERIAKVKIAPGTTVSVVASTVSPFDSAGPADVKDAKVATDKK